jgi:hypothetical protein
MALSTAAITKSYLKDLLIEVKNRKRSKLLYAKQTGIGAANVKFEGKRIYFKDNSENVLIRKFEWYNGTTWKYLRGLNGKILRYEMNENHLISSYRKINHKNYTEEANKWWLKCLGPNRDDYVSMSLMYCMERYPFDLSNLVPTRNRIIKRIEERRMAYEPILSSRCRGMKARRDENGKLIGGYEY